LPQGAADEFNISIHEIRDFTTLDVSRFTGACRLMKLMRWKICLTHINLLSWVEDRALTFPIIAIDSFSP
jgi:hypothetical protein